MGAMTDDGAEDTLYGDAHHNYLAVATPIETAGILFSGRDVLASPFG